MARITGKYGSLYLDVGATPSLAAAAKVANTYDVQIQTDIPLAECTVKGNKTRRYMAGPGGLRLTCKANFISSAALVNLTGGDIGDGLVRCAFKFVPLSTAAPGATTLVPPTGYSVVSGYGWISSASLQAPFDQKVEEELEITADGDWTFA